MQKRLQASFTRSNAYSEAYGKVKSFATRGTQPVDSTFFYSTNLCDNGTRDNIAIYVSSQVFERVGISEASTHEPEFNLKSLLASKDSGSKDAILAPCLRPSAQCNVDG